MFSINNRLIKQVDGCPIGGSISAAFSDIYVCKTEEDVVIPANPILYKRYVDHTYMRRKKHETDRIFLDLNSYHQKIKLTLETNPNKFLDTELFASTKELKRNFIAKLKNLK